jgi:phosphinothricin acetyltransferase
MTARPATKADAAAIAHIYNQGIEDRVATFETRPRECYASIAEVSVYVAREWRGKSAGRTVLNALFDAARDAGFHKLVSRVFPENAASLAMIESLSFRRVGIYYRHGQLDGVWRDVVIVEKLLT